MGDETNPLTMESVSTSTASSAVQEDEVYGTLGALLGMLEVVATDDAYPIAPVQEHRLRCALELCTRLQTYLESLLTLASDDLPVRLRTTTCRVRPLVEHAVRGALRRLEARRVTLQVPEVSAWGHELVHIDAARVDRALRGLAEALADRVGEGGAVAVDVQRMGPHVILSLRGRPGPGATAGPLGSVLLERAARRLLELHGGALSVDPRQLTIELRLPAAGES